MQSLIHKKSVGVFFAIIVSILAAAYFLNSSRNPDSNNLKSLPQKSLNLQTDDNSLLSKGSKSNGAPLNLTPNSESIDYHERKTQGEKKPLFTVPTTNPDDIDRLNYLIEQHGPEYTKWLVQNRMLQFDIYSDESKEVLQTLAENGDMDAALELTRQYRNENDSGQFTYWSKIAIANGALLPIGDLFLLDSRPITASTRAKIESAAGILTMDWVANPERAYTWVRLGALRGSYEYTLAAVEYADQLTLQQRARAEIEAQRLYHSLEKDRANRTGLPFNQLSPEDQQAFLNQACHLINCE